MRKVGGEKMPENLTSGFLLGHIRGLPGAVTNLHTVDYKRRSDGNMLGSWGTNGTQQQSKWDGRNQVL